MWLKHCGQSGWSSAKKTDEQSVLSPGRVRHLLPLESKHRGNAFWMFCFHLRRGQTIFRVGVVALPDTLHTVKPYPHRDANKQTLQRSQTKRGRQRGNIQWMMMKEKMSQLRERQQFISYEAPKEREQYTPCFVCHTKTKISAVYTLLMRPKIRVSTLVAPGGWKDRPCCFQLFDNVVFFFFKLF